jgi:hypothetical protein
MLRRRLSAIGDFAQGGNVDDLKCPFKRVLLPGDFGCRHATVVTRREGPDIACSSSSTQALCAEVLFGLKQHGLPALGYTDDLTELPHGVAMKVQMGGLLGLQRLVGVPAPETAVVADVGAVVTAGVERYGSTPAIPYAGVVEDMSAFQLKRRRGR